MLGTENITKDAFFLIWIMKLTETEIYVLFTINIVRGPRDCGKNKERKLFLQKMCFRQSLTLIYLNIFVTHIFTPCEEY